MKAGNRNFGITDKREIPATEWRVSRDFGGKTPRSGVITNVVANGFKKVTPTNKEDNDNKRSHFKKP